ncbi:MAG: TerB family tellurite resistance protein [Desulfofustis sp.]|nr:TerB family tellurite resistance protein [Desulfofustis sp.]MBT8346712.1 TerB family tellurite resistance protein [Desulfofustis sp.]NNF46609.1 TerB family tellurite resistance protein [Desulfofustis sp.]
MGDSAQAETVENQDDTHIALCVLLIEAAHIDGECSDDEMAHVIDTLTNKCGILKEDIDELIEKAYQKRKDAIDLFAFTRYLNQNYSKEEKLKVMESVWRVIHIDGRLEGHEDQFAHKLANLLRLTHKELIDAKISAREQLKT